MIQPGATREEVRTLRQELQEVAAAYGVPQLKADVQAIQELSSELSQVRWTVQDAARIREELTRIRTELEDLKTNERLARQLRRL